MIFSPTELLELADTIDPTDAYDVRGSSVNVSDVLRWAAECMISEESRQKSIVRELLKPLNRYTGVEK